MKRTILLASILCPFLIAAQPRFKEKKYPSLLWEISGKGLPKVSYLFGTMHVSSKLAFHLADSFYIGIRGADVVALETNPESWQEDMNKYDLGSMYDYESMQSKMPTMYFRRSSLRFSPYIRSVETALSSNPSSINNLLYRSYGNESSDFEEDTYLDMYIYQCGKKWGKKVTGVERYGESMRLMAEAYRDAAKDKSRRPARYDGDDDFSGARLQEAYRSGNLDWLDSINKYNSQSDAFDEKFMYRRNEIQAASIDSILRTGQSLFVGVGAAHLPGNRGVIEMLRRMGYRLRAVRMGARDSEHKTQVEKLRVPVVFRTQYAEDSFFHADVPGKLYPAGEEDNIIQQQYADMSNGSYYFVTRIQTNAWMWGHSPERVRVITDSLLYENIPGRIARKTSITRDGYPGIEIVNRTRRGDMQRYQIYFTPYEIILFKMSGTAEYVTQGTEADRFFSSIRLRAYPSAAGNATRKWSPKTGGFSALLPHEPFAGNRERWVFDAKDPGTGNYYRVIRNDIHNYAFTDQDSFDLAMMDESFGSSEFIDKKLGGDYSNTGGYPSYDAKYRDKSGSVYQVRFLIQGPHYYTILARTPKESATAGNFINSFAITPFRYGPVMPEQDTSLSFTVRTPFIDRSVKEKIIVTEPGMYDSDEEPGTGDGSVSRMRIVANDSTGETILVNYARMSDYEMLKDSALLKEFSRAAWRLDSTRIVRSAVSGQMPGGGRSFDIVLSDTGSSRIIRMKVLYTSGHAFILQTEGDTLSVPSAFVRSFFDTFQPADSLKGPDPFASKTSLFFHDLFSTDTTLHKKAIKGISQVSFEEQDLPSLNKAITTFSYREKDYLDNKKSLIRKLSDLHSAESTDFLRQLYNITADTLDLQHEILGQLLSQQTEYSFRTFRDIITKDPPVLSTSGVGASSFSMVPTEITIGRYDGTFLSGLYDTLELTAAILPDLLPLMDLKEYESSIRNVLAVVADSSLIRPKVYTSWYPRFLLQAKQLLKMQQIGEKQDDIARAEKLKDPDKQSQMDDYGIDEISNGSTPNVLATYSSLLLPFYEKQEAVRNFIAQLFTTHDAQLKYAVMLQLAKQRKPIPDTMLSHFAANDKYRVLLYNELKDMGRIELFPLSQRSQVAMAKSYLMQAGRDAPDSLVFLTRLPAKIGRRDGVVVFFKYKASKDDPTWKIANGGFMPADSTRIYFDEVLATASSSGAQEDMSLYYGGASYQLGSLGQTKLNDEQPVDEQLRKELKKILFSTHPSGRMFYEGADDEKQYGDDEAEVVPVEP